METAIVLLSGGLDSVTTLAVAVAQGLSAHALSFRYGQKHDVELGCATRQAERFGAAEHRIVDLSHMADLVRSASSLLRGSELEVPKDRDFEAGVPTTYVPARNLLFLSYAVAWAEAIDAGKIFIGVNALDYSGYPDCRPAFIEAFAAAANLGTKIATRVEIATPLQDLHKDEIIKLGVEHGVDYADTLSCYDPADGGLACGRCDSCQLRRAGFERAGVVDPTRYAPAT